MTNRRDLLKAGLWAGAIPLAGGTAFAHREPAQKQILVFSETVCPETEVFGRDVHAHRLGADPSTEMFDLDAALKKGVVKAVFGLTRNSSQFLIEQVALAHGYYPTFKGVHAYDNGSLRHEITGARSDVLRLTDQIQNAPALWPQIIARNVPVLRAAHGAKEIARFQTPLRRPQQSPGYLVSWMLEKAHD
ncbi:MAG: hypothetical protein AAGC77_10190 [Pseudomonadota bacterium]